MIEFQAGYYEWHVILNGEVVYWFDDLVDQIPYPLHKRDELNDTVDDLIDMMRYDLDSEEREIDPDVKVELYENLDDLKEAMMTRLFYEYGNAA
jgi:hypothetical protein